MQVTEVAPGVHFVKAKRVGWVLIEEGDGVTMIDAGWPRDYDVVAGSLEAIGHTPASVEALILTHAHVDHMGCAAELEEKHGTRIMSHEEEREQALGLRHEAITTPQLFVRMYRWPVLVFALDALLLGGMSVRRLEDIETFGDGEVLDLPGSPRVVFTPGHTSGSVSFYLPEKGVLAVGDALATCNIYTDDPGCELLPEEFHHDYELAIASLDRLVGLEANVILPGHGAPFEGTPAQAVEAAHAAL